LGSLSTDRSSFMSDGSIAVLQRRGAVAVGGPDAEAFLNDLVTADVSRASPGQAVFAGLLAPQGKILFDFIVFRDGDRFLFDLPRALAADFVKRIGFYKLRAKVTVEDISANTQVLAVWGPEGVRHIDGAAAPDPRLAALGWRVIAPADQPPVFSGFAPATEADYDAHRIPLGIPEGGIDFAFGDVFPHDTDMDQIAGVDFGKGCYIGQEVVSRMEHRGTARRRFVIARAEAALPAPGTEVTAGGKPLGLLGSSAGAAALALLRLDRAKDAIDTGTPIMAGDVDLTLALPGWARFGWPEAADKD
jgi:tRNA-modifying protein YgfZ